jgi:hypothetical protein
MRRREMRVNGRPYIERCLDVSCGEYVSHRREFAVNRMNDVGPVVCVSRRLA